MKRFEINANDTGKFWITSTVTSRVYFVELLLNSKSSSKPLSTRIIIRNEKNQNDNLRKSILQLSSEINPLPIIEQLDKMY